MRWPLLELMRLARMPHEDETHFGHGHTVALVDPVRGHVVTMVASTRLCGWVLRRPTWTPPGFGRLAAGRFRRIDFFSAIPVYPGELELAYEQGCAELLRRMDKAGVNDLLDPARAEVTALVR